MKKALVAGCVGFRTLAGFTGLSVVAGFASLLVMAGFAGPALAQSDSVETFYKGRTVNMVVGFSAGSSYDLYLRVVSRHLNKYIPGNPNLILQHMPGAGSLRATSYLANAAPKDGSTIGMPHPVNIIEPLIDPERSKFDPRAFQWIGAMNAEFPVCAFWAKDIRTMDDMKRREMVMGSTGPAAGSTVDVLLLKALLGMNFKVVMGYPGLPEMRMAAESGETDGMCGIWFSNVRRDFADAWKAGTVAVPLQYGLTKHPELPNVPNAYELLANDADRQLVKLTVGPLAFGRPLVAPPGTPADRVAALRKAFDAMTPDPEFRAEAKQLDLELQVRDAASVIQVVDEIMRTPPAIIERARLMIGVGNR